MIVIGSNPIFYPRGKNSSMVEHIKTLFLKFPLKFPYGVNGNTTDSGSVILRSSRSREANAPLA